MNICADDYIELLCKWANSAVNYIYEPLEYPDIACYGPGNKGHWAQQANTTALAAFAVMANDSSFNSKKAGMSRSKVLDYALKMLRFTLYSHVTGPNTTLDGEHWGHSWISALCMERVMHGIEALDEHLSDKDRHYLHKVLLSESNWIIDNWSICGDIDGFSDRNRPESNIWNGTLLHRTAILYPDAPRVDEYREYGSKFLINGISVSSDKLSNLIIDDKKISEWHVGANFTDSYGLNHHGYLNIGYMVICLSNIAMLHFSCKKREIAPPDALYHHLFDLWGLIKKCTFPDGRLWRIGGDTRVRYCYCQDYAVPMWLLMRDICGDEDCDNYEKGWFRTICAEQENNGDGSFLGERLKEMKAVSPLYYCRLEGDRAASLSMGAYWRRLFDDFANHSNVQKHVKQFGNWYDKYHGAMLEKSPKRMVSFTWLACEKPIGMCLPSDDSSMSEWRYNLVGEINGTSEYTIVDVLEHHDNNFFGGFNTSGLIRWNSTNHIAEGQADEVTAMQNIAFAALPDDETVIVFQYAKTVNRTYLKTVKGVFCNIPNDIYNHKLRRYRIGKQVFTCEGIPLTASKIKQAAKHINIDDKLDIELLYGAEEIFINRPNYRQIKLYDIGSPKYGRSGGNLHCDEICSPCNTEIQCYDANTVLFDLGFTIKAGTEENTPIGHFQALACGKNCRGVIVLGADGINYLFLANFSTEKQQVSFGVKGYSKAVLLGGNISHNIINGGINLEIKKYHSALFKLS